MRRGKQGKYCPLCDLKHSVLYDQKFSTSNSYSVLPKLLATRLACQVKRRFRKKENDSSVQMVVEGGIVPRILLFGLSTPECLEMGDNRLVRIWDGG